MLGARNPKVKELRRLATSRRSRATAGRFVVEGPTLVAELLDSAIPVVEAFHEPGASPELVAKVAARAPVHPVQEGVLDVAGDAVTSQGIVAVAAIPSRSPASIAADAPLLLLDAVADPGNVGTLVRVAEASGFGAVLLTAGSVDPWSPKVVRASAGSVLRVPVFTVGEAGEVLDELRAGGRRCIGTRATDAPAYTDLAFPAATVLVLGNEAHGLDPALDDHLDGWVRIPMSGRVESLNVAMAGAVLAYEVRRQAGGGGPSASAAADVVATVSHELRSPLTSVKGYTSLLLNRWDRITDQQKRSMLEQVHHDADRVTRLIGELLDVSRMETGRLVLRRRLIDLPALTAGVVARLEVAHPGLGCIVSFPPTFPRVHADPDKIEQVLTNLVENAVKYGSPEGVRIDGGVDGGTVVTVCVTDHGEGIPADDLPKVFQKFFRRHHGRPSGTGLGLWISRGLVEAHGGTLTAERSECGDTCFRFTLPLGDGGGSSSGSDS